MPQIDPLQRIEPIAPNHESATAIVCALAIVDFPLRNDIVRRSSFRSDAAGLQPGRFGGVSGEDRMQHADGLSPPPIVMQQIQRKNLVVTRMHCNAATDNRHSPNYHEDSYKLAYRLSDLTRSQLWVDGKLQPDEKRPTGSVAFFDLTMTNAISSAEPIEFVQFYVPRPALKGSDDKSRLVTARDLLITSGRTLDDPTIAGLAQCLLPALERQAEVNELFLDHVALALLAPLSFKYAAEPVTVKSDLGKLAPWQLRRAQELIAAHLDGNLHVAEIAAECGLSSGYFERAFAKSTGKPPHRWLRDRRLERSKELLLGSGLSIAEIALACGFADQAHLTRLFGAAVGMSPGRWRRMNRC